MITVAGVCFGPAEWTAGPAAVAAEPVAAVVFAADWPERQELAEFAAAAAAPAEAAVGPAGFVAD